MQFSIEGTNYQKFDAWFCFHAKRLGYLVSYDDAGLIDDLGDIQDVPKKYYPLKIYLSKIYPDGRAYDWDAFFIVEETGSRIWVTFSIFENRKKNVVPMLEAIAKYWPNAAEVISKVVEESDTTNERDILPKDRPESNDQVDIQLLSIPKEFLLSLKPDEKIIVQLWNEGRTGTEIGTRLGKDRDTIRNQVTNIRKKLKKYLGDENQARKLIRYHNNH